jgi:hypothetical protein
MAEKKEEKELGLTDFLSAFPNAPSAEQIEQWKVQHGEVFVSGFSEIELFVWRPLTRPEWIRLQMLAASPEAQMDQYKFEEAICNMCVLWKAQEKTWDQGKAGTVSTLQEQIMQQSNFLTPQAASMLVAKL